MRLDVHNIDRLGFHSLIQNEFPQFVLFLRIENTLFGRYRPLSLEPIDRARDLLHKYVGD